MFCVPNEFGLVFLLNPPRRRLGRPFGPATELVHLVPTSLRCGGLRMRRPLEMSAGPALVELTSPEYSRHDTRTGQLRDGQEWITRCYRARNQDNSLDVGFRQFAHLRFLANLEVNIVRRGRHQGIRSHCGPTSSKCRAQGVRRNSPTFERRTSPCRSSGTTRNARHFLGDTEGQMTRGLIRPESGRVSAGFVPLLNCDDSTCWYTIKLCSLCAKGRSSWK